MQIVKGEVKESQMDKTWFLVNDGVTIPLWQELCQLITFKIGWFVTQQTVLELKKGLRE